MFIQCKNYFNIILFITIILKKSVQMLTSSDQNQILEQFHKTYYVRNQTV